MDLWSVISLFILIALSAFFSGSEIAFASASKVRLKTASESDNPYARMALYIYDHFEDALSAILIGNNLVNIAASSDCHGDCHCISRAIGSCGCNAGHDNTDSHFW